MADAPVSPTGPDLDLRLVRYFATVAEHLNFGRAATALHVAQPSLSRQIQRLEDQLGVRLFDRTPQGSRLTEAGHAFLPQAQALLDAAHRATLAARAAAPAHAITIGYVEDLVVTPAVRELRRRHPDAQVRTRHLSWQDTHALPERRVDALVARRPLPFPTDHLRVTLLYEEPRILVVPASHPLADSPSVTLEDLDDLGEQNFVACNSTAAIWSMTPPLAPRPADGPAQIDPGPGPDDSFEDKLELVANGHAIGILPAGDRRSTLRADLATIPLKGIDPCEVVLATRANDHNPLITTFRQFTRTHLTGTA
ncbi:DNA-binding transcriptional LysR family regulator [Streptomyces aurantiacus]|uniref:LysR family transcriptional regulator n=1 Tax=Streptomyces aurantiacus TaxID=47760 RepID=UPI00279158C9|nr:LysR family transcriptional regulator [Streptomyces aurantiacus]MDQ0775577.1 DNA-binding transcriptional LysR family regulator [Streptomyces aurantiacus]